MRRKGRGTIARSGLEGWIVRNPSSGVVEEQKQSEKSRTEKKKINGPGYDSKFDLS